MDSDNKRAVQIEEASRYLRGINELYLSDADDFGAFKKRAADVMKFAELAIKDVLDEKFADEEFSISDVYIS